MATSDTGFKSPTGTGSPLDEWLNGAAIKVSDNNRANTNLGTAKEDSDTYNFEILSNAEILGIEVVVEGAWSL